MLPRCSGGRSASIKASLVSAPVLANVPHRMGQKPGNRSSLLCVARVCCARPLSKATDSSRAAMSSRSKQAPSRSACGPTGRSAACACGLAGVHWRSMKSGNHRARSASAVVVAVARLVAESGSTKAALAESWCRRGRGEPSPGTDVGGVILVPSQARACIRK
jgi:hypothetical protein